MNPNEELPERLEVRRSVPKLIAFGAFAAPFALVLVLMFVLALMVLYLQRPDLLQSIITVGGGMILISVAICWWCVSLWRRVSAYDPFFILTPDGLVMPSLGSTEPVPWDDVRTMWSPGLGLGLWRSFYLELDADPHIYPNLLGPFMAWRKPQRAGEKVKLQKSFHATFDLGVAKLRETIDQFKEHYAMKDENSAKKQPPASFWVVAAFGSILTTAMFTAIFYRLFEPIAWFGLAILGFICIMEIPVLFVFYDLYKKASGTKSAGLKWSGFGEQRPDIGTMKKR